MHMNVALKDELRYTRTVCVKFGFVMQSSISVLIPAGPACKLPFLSDTLDSVLCHAGASTSVIIVDDAGNGIPQAAAAGRTNVKILPATVGSGGYGELYLNLAMAIEHILKINSACEVIVKLDDDGLVIGYGGDLEALEFFTKNPEIAIAGSYRVDCMGRPRDFGPAARRMLFLASIGAFREPAASREMRRLLFAARRNGYELGEHCLGGVAFFNAAAFRVMAARDMLIRPDLLRSRLGEDHLFGLLARACGYRIADFASDDLPLGVAWRGLPCSPEELLRRGKKLTHSVRSWGDMDEVEIRRFFSERRRVAPVAGLAPVP